MVSAPSGGPWRGESMADVIFSGSSTRKPVGTAMVELIFDNSEGRVGGQFAGYNEISVKRQVSRDGQSSYFLNGATGGIIVLLMTAVFLIAFVFAPKHGLLAARARARTALERRPQT